MAKSVLENCFTLQMLSSLTAVLKIALINHYGLFSKTCNFEFRLNCKKIEDKLITLFITTLEFLKSLCREVHVSGTSKLKNVTLSVQ